MPKDKTQSHARIIEAARDEFLEYGFADASLRRIASKARIQVGGLYRHFAGKEEMFDSLVEPAISAFYELYHMIEKEYFEEDLASDSVDGWESKNEGSRIMGLIYDYLDEFRLLIMKSQGSKYEDFIHKAATLEEETTLRYLAELQAKGHPVRGFDRREFHLLTTSYVESFFQPVIHGLSREEAMHYAGTLEDFYAPAWKAWLNI